MDINQEFEPERPNWNDKFATALGIIVAVLMVLKTVDFTNFHPLNDTADLLLALAIAIGGKISVIKNK